MLASPSVTRRRQLRCKFDWPGASRPGTFGTNRPGEPIPVPGRPSRRETLVTPPDNPATPSPAEASTSEDPKLRERRRKRHGVGSGRRTGLGLIFLNIDPACHFSERPLRVIGSHLD